MPRKKGGKAPRSIETLGIHGEGDNRETGHPVVPPPILSATFFGGYPGDQGELRYGRYGNNPTLEALGRKLAALEGMEAGIALGSGMAAISLTCLSLTRAGDHILASSHLYGATLRFMKEELVRRGVEVTFVDPDAPRNWRRLLRARTRLLYVELPANPTLRVPDPRPIAQLARSEGLPFVIDATFATPVNLRAGELGADIVVHSASKYLGGHSDLIGGAVCGADDVVREVGVMLRHYGPALDPHAAWLLDRGIRTLSVRMERHNRNGLELAQWFEEQPEVEEVRYPGLPSHPDHQTAREILNGYGGMVGVVLKGGVKESNAFLRALRLAAVAPSLGGVETLVSLPRLTSHRDISPKERAALGIEDGFVRISVGLEGADDLKEDFRRGLDAMPG